MEVRFNDDTLDRLEIDLAFDGGYGRTVVKGFRKVMQSIRTAKNERDLYQMKSLRFEKLKGDRSHERSLRINDQWRLIIQIESGIPKNIVIVTGIEDYH